MRVCVYACMHVCVYACMHVCVYACMHAYACKRMYLLFQGVSRRAHPRTFLHMFVVYLTQCFLLHHHRRCHRAPNRMQSGNKSLLSTGLENGRGRERSHPSKTPSCMDMAAGRLRHCPERAAERKHESVINDNGKEGGCRIQCKEGGTWQHRMYVMGCVGGIRTVLHSPSSQLHPAVMHWHKSEKVSA